MTPLISPGAVLRPAAILFPRDNKTARVFSRAVLRWLGPMRFADLGAEQMNARFMEQRSLPQQ